MGRMERASGASRYERLVERWTDLAAWPTARKTVMASALAAAFHAVMGVCAIFFLSLSPGLLDLRRLAVFLAVWIGAILVVCLASLRPARRGDEGRWTVYLMIVVYGSCVWILLMLLGLLNTPWFALAPLVVLLVPVFWDLSAGRFALGFMLALLSLGSWLELTGRVPVAPLFQMRTLDAQSTLGWHLATGFYVSAVLGYVFLLTYVTISTRNNQQRRLVAAHRELEAASRHKSEFLANMSHELRTPLNAVIGFSEVLQARMFGDLNDKQAEYVGDILHSGRHLLSLINDILDLSKVEAGRMDLEPSEFDLTAAIENALTLTQERASRRGLRLERSLSRDLGRVSADERKVKQVLINLLTNAIKFTPEGGTIRVSARRDSDAVTLAVADTGIGISPADQTMIFEEFRQVRNDHTRKQEGTGLGLALSKRFVELHGGRLLVESALGHGSTFTFTLPVTAARPAAVSL